MNPSGLAMDPANNLYVADTANNTIRKITPAGIVTTLAGLAGQSGTVDGLGAAARFNAPRAVAVDHAGNVYVADTANSAIRLITPAGAVSTFAGQSGFEGASDGAGAYALFWNPAGIAVDPATNVFVADTGNYTLRKITPDRNVSTVAGLAGQPGISDGVGPDARFTSPYGIAVDAQGNIYLADTATTTSGGHAGGSRQHPGRIVRLCGQHRWRGQQREIQQPPGNRRGQFRNVFVADAGNYSVRLGQNSALFGPALSISFMPNYAVLSWPSAATGYLVESSPVPSATAVWTPLTNPPPVIIGNNFVFSNLLGPSAVFYRLHK